MAGRKENFVSGEYYHCYNRGSDKRVTFLDAEDFKYFLDILKLFNQSESLGSMRTYRSKKNYSALMRGDVHELVSISSYCINPNHFHLLLEQKFESGITKFMRKVGTGYTMYFNKKYKRSGVLFQGRFKSVHIKSDPQLRLLLAYISLNYKVHNIKNTKKYKSSMSEFSDNQNGWTICDPALIRQLYKDNSMFRQDTAERVKEIIVQRKMLTETERSELLE